MPERPTFRLRRAKRVREKWMVATNVGPELFPGDSAASQVIKAYAFVNGEKGSDVTDTLLEGAGLEGDVAKVRLQAGADGADYLLDFQVTTQAGDVIVHTLVVAVRGA